MLSSIKKMHSILSCHYVKDFILLILTGVKPNVVICYCRSALRSRTFLFGGTFALSMVINNGCSSNCSPPVKLKPVWPFFFDLSR